MRPVRPDDYDLPMTNTKTFDGALDLPVSVFEVMGDEALAELRHHAAGVLCACAAATKLRRDAPFVGDDFDVIDETVRSCVQRIFDALAESAGLPGEGQSLSRRRGAKPDFRTLASGCMIWMGTVNTRGYPELGRRSKYRHNRPAIMYWMLVHGPLPEGMRLERTCGERLCINPDHGELLTRSEQGARIMRERSPLDWEAVREIRRAVPAGEDPDQLGERFGVSRHSVLEVFRNITWHDPDYEPGVDRRCAGCPATFKTTHLGRRYCSNECLRAGLTRQQRRRGDCEPTLRQRRDRDRLRHEMDAATEQYRPKLDREVRPTWGRSLDAMLGETRSTLHDILADTSAEDPAAALEAAYISEVLGDLTEEKIEGLDADQLIDWQVRLSEAGLLPQTSTAVG